MSMTDLQTSPPLRLRALDAEDLQVMSGLLQDAIVTVGDMAFDQETHEFSLAVQRFRWELLDDVEVKPDPARCQRIHSALIVSHVAQVKTLNLDFSKRAQVLDLLALMGCDEGLKITFAGGVELKLMGQNWQVKLADFGEAWPTQCKPCHSEALAKLDASMGR
ncbi:MAG: DUF2948 family protein [Alphaproteobacteria bacterium]|nr:DUF2948 family protein [Alphaproteobacteria bacterium]NDC56322.1 DUF2948 family protein [Alphaproteobacteria bacterium]NDG04035.1 DUF2948 family protein [Alphaproteobacteria bacterium]